MCKERFRGTFTNDRTIEVLNQRASMKAMDKWKDASFKGQDLINMRQAREEILDLCDNWITEWKKQPTLVPSAALLDKLPSLKSLVIVVEYHTESSALHNMCYRGPLRQWPNFLQSNNTAFSSENWSRRILKHTQALDKGIVELGDEMV